jgi:hypothetical protein
VILFFPSDKHHHWQNVGLLGEAGRNSLCDSVHTITPEFKHSGQNEVSS